MLHHLTENNISWDKNIMIKIYEILLKYSILMFILS